MENNTNFTPETNPAVSEPAIDTAVPAEAAPAAAAPAEAATVEAAAVESAPAEAVPVEDIPLYATPIEPASAEAAPAQAASTEAAPVMSKAKSKGKKIGIIVAASLLGVLLLLIAGGAMFINSKLSEAQSLLEQGDPAGARAIYEEYQFLASGSRLMDCDYVEAKQLADAGDYVAAREKYLSIREYKDAAEQADAVYYAYADQLVGEGKYDEAILAYTQLPEGYEDSAEKINACRYTIAEQYYNDGDFSKAATAFGVLGDYEDAAERSIDSMIKNGIALSRDGKHDEAEAVLERYIAEYDEALIYYFLNDMYRDKAANEVGYAKYHYNTLLEYADNADVAEALKDPYFFFHRFFGAGWKWNGYTIDCKTSDNTLYHYVPWKTPDGSPNYKLDGDRIKVLCDDSPWFYINGFDSFDELHPNEIYLESPDGKEYTFKRYKLFDE